MKRAFLLLVLLLLSPRPPLSRRKRSQPPPQVRSAVCPHPQVAAIRAVIDAQVAAWNRGDIPAFMQAYEDSPDTTFIGLTLRKGFQPIRERYLLSYTTPEQMGTLTFSDLDVRLLPSSCGQLNSPSSPASSTSTAKPKAKPRKTTASFRWSGAKAPHGWKIIVDHTS